jgi:hypothetical protein
VAYDDTEIRRHQRHPGEQVKQSDRDHDRRNHHRGQEQEKRRAAEPATRASHAESSQRSDNDRDGGSREADAKGADHRAEPERRRGELLAVGFGAGFLQSFEELTIALFVGGGLKTTLPKQMWDGILLQVNPIITAASVVVLLVVILMFAIIECIQERRTGGRRWS